MSPVFKIFEVCSYQNILKNSAGGPPVLGVLPSAIYMKEDRNSVSVRGPSQENSFSLRNVYRILPERNIS